MINFADMQYWHKSYTLTIILHVDLKTSTITEFQSQMDLISQDNAVLYAFLKTSQKGMNTG